MKIIRYLIFIILLLPLRNYLQTKSFEGEVVILFTNSSETTKYDIKIKDHRFKIDFYTANQKNDRSLLINLKTNEIFELNNLRKNYRYVNPKSFEYTTLPQYSLKKDLKDIEKIMSYYCDKWIVSENLNENISIYRITKNDKFFYLKKTFRYLNITNNTFRFIDLFAKSDNIIPLSVIKYNKNGKIISSIIIKSLSKKKITEQELKVPKNFESWN